MRIRKSGSFEMKLIKSDTNLDQQKFVRKRVIDAFECLLEMLVGSRDFVPYEVRECCRALRVGVQNRFGKDLAKKFLAEFLFSQFICPTLTVPDSSLDSELSGMGVLMAKIAQRLDSGIPFSESMSWANVCFDSKASLLVDLFLAGISSAEQSKEGEDLVRICTKRFIEGREQAQVTAPKASPNPPKRLHATDRKKRRSSFSRFHPTAVLGHRTRRNSVTGVGQTDE
eukprot:CAMPEP_0201502340 /NCGR_PEP_ID=MMETSP0151_2-20130828/84083_1 /ASSEMBLY_ACC=CAM_ASM_000257 /TAXON_ID=200890 /ORGANISM="Paramoeba atlantica, Strain 621/1 / CCAP 1560/9" /LENGTH=226 /DNA_ID=CAMNT_0047895927 /DNA_START=1592 /DNA_END=2272 /DNA_ORIENTATION=-